MTRTDQQDQGAGAADERALAPFFNAVRHEAPLRPELLSAILADAAAASAAPAWPARRIDLGRRLRDFFEPLGGLRSAAALGICAALGFGAGLAGGISLDGTGTWSDTAAAEAAAEPVVAFFDFAAED